MRPAFAWSTGIRKESPRSKFSDHPHGHRLRSGKRNCFGTMEGDWQWNSTGCIDTLRSWNALADSPERTRFAMKHREFG